MASGNTGFQVGKSIKFVVNCSLLTFLLRSGDLNPILGFCFPLLQGGIVRAHEQRETRALGRALGGRRSVQKAHQVERMFLVDITPQLNALGRTRSFSCDRGEVF